MSLFCKSMCLLRASVYMQGSLRATQMLLTHGAVPCRRAQCLEKATQKLHRLSSAGRGMHVSTHRQDKAPGTRLRMRQTILNSFY
jgi:hypothetical protein